MALPPGLPSDLDPPRLLSIAAGLLDAAEPRFLEGVGAPSAVDKGGNDFATELDLELERTLSAQLSEQTGIAVHGEEFGGPDPAQGTVWVIDPIDGTFNYSAGLPLAGMLLALLHDGLPVLGLTWLPMIDRRYAATVDGPVTCNGEPLPPLRPTALNDTVIAVGAFNLDSRVDSPTVACRRVGRGVAAGLPAPTARQHRHRHGVHRGREPRRRGVFRSPSVGQRAGCGAGDRRRWRRHRPHGRSVDRCVVVDVGRLPGVHSELLEIIAGVGDPEDFR